MDVREKLRSYPVIAAAVIAAALLIGMLIGLAGPKARPLPVGGQSEEAEQGGSGVKTGKPDNTKVGRNNPDGTGSNTSHNGGPRDSSNPDKQPKDPRKTGTPESTSGIWSRPKELKPGRKDTMAARVDLPVPQSSLLVIVKTSADYSIAQAALFLDIAADGLGWQRVAAKPQPTGNTGEWRYTDLYAGTYLVSAAVPGYNDASQQVLIAGGTQEAQVRLELPPPQYGRIIFNFTYEDGGKPQTVFCQRSELNGREGAIAGRFGQYGGTPAELGSKNSGVANYAIPPENDQLIFSVRIEQKEKFTFSAQRETKRYSAEITVAGKLNGEQRFDISLKLLDATASDPTGGYFPREAAKAEFTFTRSDNAAVTLRRCNLRVSPESATYTAASSLEGNKATFLSVQPGNYFLVAEADGLNAAYVKPMTITAGTNLPLLIELAQLTIQATRDTGVQAPQGMKWTYRAALRPLASGSIETFYNREIVASANTDSATYTVPVGSYTIVTNSNDALLACEPPSTPLTITRDGAFLNVTLRTASTLEFTCVDSYNNPVAGVEFLISYSPAGEIPEAEKTRVELGGSGGHCQKTGAVYGRVYLHIWVTSKDFQAPDRTYEIDLPSYGVLNLGAITVK
jgi:hypothetical protein